MKLNINTLDQEKEEEKRNLGVAENSLGDSFEAISDQLYLIRRPKPGKEYAWEQIKAVVWYVTQFVWYV